MADELSGSRSPAAPARPPTAAERRRRVSLRLAVLAAVWAAGLALAAVLVPAYDGETVSAVNGVTLTRLTLVQSHGAWIVGLVMFPLPAALSVLGTLLAPAERRVPVEVGGSRFEVTEARREIRLLRHLATAATALVGIEGLVAVASAGALVLPVAILGGLALALSARR